MFLQLLLEREVGMP
uniref:Uncharacterized protein n=1 Tax=Lepeophtheirus salmonis TaxID=72036 RepID=A0A0K2V9B5_LEPSM